MRQCDAHLLSIDKKNLDKSAEITTLLSSSCYKWYFIHSPVTDLILETLKSSMLSKFIIGLFFFRILKESLPHLKVKVNQIPRKICGIKKFVGLIYKQNKKKIVIPFLKLNTLKSEDCKYIRNF